MADAQSLLAIIQGGLTAVADAGVAAEALGVPPTPELTIAIIAAKFAAHALEAMKSPTVESRKLLRERTHALLAQGQAEMKREGSA